MIFFLSGTGNSFYVARRLALETHDIVTSIGHALTQESKVFRDERIGIVCPVYNHELPPLVKRFVSQTLLETPYLYLVLTHGNKAGGAQIIAQRFLEERGFEPAYINTILMVDNWLCGYDIAQERTLEKHTDENLDAIAKDIVENRRFLKSASEEELAIYYRGIEKYGHLFEDVSFLENFLAITEACTGCGTCVHICPSGCINLESDGVQTFALRTASSGLVCTACLGCVHACPAHAIIISMGEINPAEHYLNEHIALEDLMHENNLSSLEMDL